MNLLEWIIEIVISVNHVLKCVVVLIQLNLLRYIYIYIYIYFLIWFCDFPISTNFAIGVEGLEVFAKEIHFVIL